MKSANRLSLAFAALLTAATWASAAPVFEVTTDGSATAFYLEAGAVEAGGNFLYVEVTAPDGARESLRAFCFSLVDDRGCAFPWTNYGDLVPANARAFVVFPRAWPPGTRFDALLLDRDGAELLRATFTSAV